MRVVTDLPQGASEIILAGRKYGAGTELYSFRYKGKTWLTLGGGSVHGPKTSELALAHLEAARRLGREAFVSDTHDVTDGRVVKITPGPHETTYAGMISYDPETDDFRTFVDLYGRVDAACREWASTFRADADPTSLVDRPVAYSEGVFEGIDGIRTVQTEVTPTPNEQKYIDAGTLHLSPVVKLVFTKGTKTYILLGEVKVWVAFAYEIEAKKVGRQLLFSRTGLDFYTHVTYPCRADEVAVVVEFNPDEKLGDFLSLFSKVHTHYWPDYSRCDREECRHFLKDHHRRRMSSEGGGQCSKCPCTNFKREEWNQ